MICCFMFRAVRISSVMGAELTVMVPTQYDARKSIGSSGVFVFNVCRCVCVCVSPSLEE